MCTSRGRIDLNPFEIKSCKVFQSRYKNRRMSGTPAPPDVTRKPDAADSVKVHVLCDFSEGVSLAELPPCRCNPVKSDVLNPASPTGTDRQVFAPFSARNHLLWMWTSKIQAILEHQRRFAPVVSFGCPFDRQCNCRSVLSTLDLTSGLYTDSCQGRRVSRG